MKIIDERISKQEIRLQAEELTTVLSENLYEEYGLTLSTDSAEFLTVEFTSTLAKLFDIKLK